MICQAEETCVEPFDDLGQMIDLRSQRFYLVFSPLTVGSLGLA